VNQESAIQHKQGENVRLLLLDEQALFRASLSRLLALQPGIEVVGDCTRASEALEILAASPVDVTLLDFDNANEGNDGFMSLARGQGYQGSFLIVTGDADARHTALAIRLGASGVFLKSEPPERLVQAIQVVANGAVWFDQRVIRCLADEPKDGALSERERKVLLGILSGLTNRKIGNNLGLSESAVKSSVQQLFLKTGVRTRSQLVRAALEGSLGAASAIRQRHSNG
jgi:DNA-binding NarL/FixJ family response regulator